MLLAEKLRFMRLEQRTVVLVCALAVTAAWNVRSSAQGLIDLPGGVAAPRPITAPGGGARGVFLDPFASSADAGSPVVPASLWQTLSAPTFEHLPAPTPSLDARLAPPLKLETRAAEDLAAVGQLVPGQEIHPIDLSGALRLAGARDLDIAKLESMIDEVSLDDALAKAHDLMAGKVRGRVVVRIG